MKLETFDPNHFASTGRIFTEEFEDANRFAYHGTSTQHSASIEHGGFLPYKPLFASADLLTLAASIPDQTHSTVTWLRDEATTKKRLSFAQYAVRAAGYAMRGQSIGVIQDAVNAGGQLPPAIASFMQAATLSQPCIYVIDFEDLSNLDIDLQYGVIHCKTALLATRIAAKMILPINPALQDAVASLPPAYKDRPTPLGIRVKDA